jgi:two-component system NtrC family sensor kinase
MKLARKLVLAIDFGILLVMACLAWALFARHEEMVRLDDAEDVEVVAVLARSVARLVNDGDGLYARALFADGPARPVTLRWVERIQPGTGPIAPGRVIPRIGADGRHYIVVQAPAALEVSSSLAGHRAFLRRNLGNIGIATAAIVLLGGGLAVGVGVWFVHRPVELLREKARAVAAGEPGPPVVLRQRDELGELAHELNAMAEGITRLRHADRLRTLGQIASGVAHELGTPLNVIAARARMIASGEVAGEEITQNARQILDQSGRMTGLIRQLLDFSRREEPRPGPTDLARIAARTVEMLVPVARDRGVTIELVGDTASLPVYVDERQLEQALTNVMLNGIQAMRAGGRLTVALGRRHGQPPRDVGGPAGEYPYATVTDEGEGIAPEHLPRIFEPFFTTKSAGEGTGLGLAVASAIAREHGGWIDVASEVGRGSRFTLFVRPLAVAAASAEEAA